MGTNKSVHILVEGRVQGVGFRYFVKRIAEENSLTGWVRNRYDDRVEILAQGEEEKLTRFISTVRVGPGSSSVTDLKIEWLEPETKFARFSIAATI